MRINTTSKIQQRTIPDGVWWIGATGMLLYAMFVALSINHHLFAPSQLHNYYSHYGEGYVHRGFIGSLIRLFVGTPTPESIRYIVPRLDVALITANLIILWALLVPRILKLRQATSERAAWFALTAVLLLSPLWKEMMERDGYFDEHVHFLSLLAMLMLIHKRPLMLVIFGSIAILIHRQGIFYTTALGLMAIHLACWHPDYRRQWHLWAGVFIFFPLFFGLSFIINDKAAAMQMFADANIPEITQRLDKLKVENVAAGGRKVAHLMSLYLSAPSYTLLGFAIYALPPLILTLLLPWLATICRLQFTTHSLYVRWAGFALPLAMSLISLPIVFMSHGWSRHLHTLWMFLGMAMVYYLWFAKPEESAKQRGKKARGHHSSRQTPPSIFTAVIAVVLTAMAWLYGGMSLVVGSAEAPWLHPCRQYCVAGITSHQIGRDIAWALWRLQANAVVPFAINAGEFSNSFAYPHSLPTRSDNLLVPSNYDKKFIHAVYLFRPKYPTFTLRSPTRPIRPIQYD